MLPSHGEALPFVFVMIALVVIMMSIIFVKKKKIGIKDIVYMFIPELLVMFCIPMVLYLGAPTMSIANATSFASRYQSLCIFGVLGIFFYSMKDRIKGEII